MHRYQPRRLVTDQPQELSDFVADVHPWWYRRRGLPGQRLLVQCCVQSDSLWTQRLAAVPVVDPVQHGTLLDELQRSAVFRVAAGR